ncbi:hypothetical protein ATO49_28845 [Mycolicibacterium fortuitum subsp. fortuitum DSM 46621 = ATCC 6841 = JCM 6387]|nr:hypothetical protein ATO49_28845 [Mycolicibacterium fortuitum subsp. fortuitum DSM 46621 = ATCC 6841 = JCM 6387]
MLPFIGFKVLEQARQLVPGAGTPALHRPFRDPEQQRRLGHGIALHVDGHHRGALLERQLHQGPFHHDRRRHSGRRVSGRVAQLHEVIELVLRRGGLGS